VCVCVCVRSFGIDLIWNSWSIKWQLKYRFTCAMTMTMTMANERQRCVWLVSESELRHATCHMPHAPLTRSLSHSHWLTSLRLTRTVNLTFSRVEFAFWKFIRNFKFCVSILEWHPQWKCSVRQWMSFITHTLTFQGRS